ncbi:geopeptide [Geomonas subterranea]|uniref:Geopeptide n=1 Tax=Geomonas subterranea TaxID=2847989 RepID=A0ABX8LIB1_9BACT|nr:MULTISPECIES: geopeptide [Geomonas]QXE91773.1 geopeptide [Geomonas subterranea]QXM10134.1 geopeptide [Geomonas subterranea]
MTKENLAVEILDEGNNNAEMTDGFGCCIYMYIWAGWV